MPHWEFPRTEPIDLSVQSSAGTVTVIAQATDLITLDIEPVKSGQRAHDYAAVTVDAADDHLNVTEPDPRSWVKLGTGLNITVTVPAGSNASVTTASADITCSGEIGSLKATSASGEIEAASVGSHADLDSISGGVAVAEVGGTATLKSASGPIVLGRAGGDLNITNISGKVRVGSAEAAATIKTASGQVRIDRLQKGKADITSVSGDIRVYVAPGTEVYLDVSSVTGRASSDLDDSDAGQQTLLELACRTISGSVKVGRSE